MGCVMFWRSTEFGDGDAGKIFGIQPHLFVLDESTQFVACILGWHKKPLIVVERLLFKEMQITNGHPSPNGYCPLTAPA